MESKKKKEEILLYSEEHGVSRASREFNVSTATIYSWKRKFDELGDEGLKSIYNYFYYYTSVSDKK